MCSCGPRTKINGKDYPPAAKLEIPGMAWIAGMFGGGSSGDKGGGKEDL